MMIGAYYTSWCNYPPRNFSPVDIPVDKITHLFYAFANVSKHGLVEYGDKWADVEKMYLFNGIQLFGNIDVINNPQGPLRTKSNFKSLISVGGWTFSKYFSSSVRTKQSREKFAQSIVQFVEKHKFDGVDCDWEFVVEGGLDGNEHDEQDGNNFAMFLELLAGMLNGKLLTVAVSALTSHARNLNVHQLAKYCDFVNVMTYDNSGAWSSETNHHSALEPFGRVAIQTYQQLGLPASKISFGVPMYGRIFGKVNSNDEKKGKQFKIVPPGTFGEGMVDYDDYKNYKQQGFKEYYDEEAIASVLWNKETKTWVSIETIQTYKKKLEFIKNSKLAGVFFWELSMDRKFDFLTLQN